MKTDEMKKCCSKCKTVKVLTEFYKSKSGYHNYCRECYKEYMRRYMRAKGTNGANSTAAVIKDKIYNLKKNRVVENKYLWSRMRKVIRSNFYDTRSKSFSPIYRESIYSIYSSQSIETVVYDDTKMIDRELFTNWSLADKNFNNLFVLWVKSRYDQKHTPKAYKINASLGFVEGNIRWTTEFEENKN